MLNVNEMSGMASRGQGQRRPAKVSRVERSEKTGGRREDSRSQSSIQKDLELEASLGYIVAQGESQWGNDSEMSGLCGLPFGL